MLEGVEAHEAEYAARITVPMGPARGGVVTAIEGEPRMCTRRLSLPSSEAKELLRLLHLEGVHAGTIYPGHKGVVQALAERRHWQ